MFAQASLLQETCVPNTVNPTKLYTLNNKKATQKLLQCTQLQSLSCWATENKYQIASINSDFLVDPQMLM